MGRDVTTIIVPASSPAKIEPARHPPRNKVVPNSPSAPATQHTQQGSTSDAEALRTAPKNGGSGQRNYYDGEDGGGGSGRNKKGAQMSAASAEDEDEDEGMIRDIEEGMLDVFSDAYCNKHLVYGLLELVLVRVMPELAEKGVTGLWGERVS